MTYQFEGLNNANPATFTGVLPLSAFDQYATANYSRQLAERISIRAKPDMHTPASCSARSAPPEAAPQA
jgi:hypothetical protein